MEGHYSMVARDVFNGRPVVFAVDAEGVFTLSEGPGLEVLGLRAGEMVGRCAFEAYAGEPSVSENLSRALSGESFASVVEVAGASFECLYNPLRDAAGSVVGAVGLAVEAPGRGSRVEEALVESEERYRALVENVQEGVGLLGPGEDALVEYCNAAYAEVLGLLPDELVGRSFLGFLDEEGKEEMLRHRSLRREGVPAGWRQRVREVLGMMYQDSAVVPRSARGHDVHRGVLGRGALHYRGAVRPAFGHLQRPDLVRPVRGRGRLGRHPHRPGPRLGSEKRGPPGFVGRTLRALRRRSSRRDPAP